MNKEALQEALELAYRTNWYIRKEWADPKQQNNARRANEQLLKVLTGGAYKSDLLDDREAEIGLEVPEIKPIEGYKPPSWLIGGSSFPIVGRRFTKDQFYEYCKWVKKNESFKWNPAGCTAHHTAFPSLSMRPNGFTEAHMKNLRGYYKDQLKWRSGPQVFTDDHGIWVLTPLSHRGVHARSFNSSHIGVEMLGDFDWKDDPETGRGKQSTDNGKFSIAAMCKAFGFSPQKTNLHRDDPRTSKTCPGKKIGKADFLADVEEFYSALK